MYILIQCDRQADPPPNLWVGNSIKAIIAEIRGYDPIDRPDREAIKSLKELEGSESLRSDDDWPMQLNSDNPEVEYWLYRV